MNATVPIIILIKDILPGAVTGVISITCLELHISTDDTDDISLVVAEQAIAVLLGSNRADLGILGSTADAHVGAGAAACLKDHTAGNVHIGQGGGTGANVIGNDHIAQNIQRTIAHGHCAAGCGRCDEPLLGDRQQTG